MIIIEEEYIFEINLLYLLNRFSLIIFVYAFFFGSSTYYTYYDNVRHKLSYSQRRNIVRL